MGASSGFPARRTDGVQPSPVKLELVSYAESRAPESGPLSSPRSLIRERRLPDQSTVAILSGMAGYIDAVGFLSLLGLLPAHVTGELVGLTTAFTAGHPMTHASRFAVIPLFIVALFVAAFVTRSRRMRGQSPRVALLGLMTAALVLCTATGFLNPQHGTIAFSCVIGVREASVIAAMAFQNAFTREGMTSSCPTTVMTGNMTAVAFELVETLFARFGRNSTNDTYSRSASSRLPLVASAVGSFFLGAVVGGFLTGIVGAISIAIPTLVALLLYRREVAQ